MIHARGLSLNYGGQPALADVNVDAPAGQFVSIVGPSGCGKSTLLKLVAGLLAPSAGTLTVAGRAPDLSQKGPPRVGFVFQDPTLLPWRTVAENIRLPLELAKAPKDAMRESVAESLATIGLSAADAWKFPRELSGGMRMRVSLARVLVEKPDVLLFDEPFAALDDMLRQQLNEELMSVWLRRRPTALFVTHNISEAIYLSQRVLFMSHRPGTIAGELIVDLDYPRARLVRSTSQFASLLGQAAAMLEQAAAPGKTP
jgi:NitT/TauT family transport system ATP-binding protein